MIDTILVRYFTRFLTDQFREVCAIIEGETDFKVVEVGHTELRLSDFDVGDCNVISIDRHLAAKFRVPHVEMSRVFNIDGTIAGRHVMVPKILDTDNACIIDTDIVSGDSIREACRLIGTNRYSVPLVLTPNQDLIDIEDLCRNESRFTDDIYRSYLCNPEFFERRTSLPARLYPRFCRVFAGFDISMAA